MIAPPIFSDNHMIAAMQKLYTIMDASCNCVGDVSLGEHSLLANIAEFDSGFFLSWIKADFECFGDPLGYADLLEEKELVTRIRSNVDRRSFALCATQKGHARLGLVDEACATSLVFAHERWSESEFEYLVTKMHALPNFYGKNYHTTTLFPGAFLSLVQKYHLIVVRAAAYYAMTSLQATILCGFSHENEDRDIAHFEKLLNLPRNAIATQMSDLAKKGLIRAETTFSLTEKGSQRLHDFSRKMSIQIDSLFTRYPVSAETPFEELGEYCIYLMT